MFKWLISLFLPKMSESEVMPGVVTHDFTERVVGHDIAMTVYPSTGEADALITSLEKIAAGELISVVVSGEELDFIVVEVEELEPMIYRAKLENI